MSLTSAEIKLCEKLGDVWNDFCKLQIMHPSDETDFMNAVHLAQYIIMKRSAQRDHTDVFYIQQSGNMSSVTRNK